MTWQTDAACIGKPTAWWYGDDPFTTEVAHAICRRCPVRGACLAAALDEESRTDTFGIRGGVDADQRRRLHVVSA